MKGLDSTVNAFMRNYDIPGMSVAVTRKGKLAYLKAYGKADLEANQNVTTASLFRLASVSKTLTSVAIMTLMEEGKISLDDKVFGEGALLGTTYGTKPYTDWLKAITVKHLLQHTAGGWPNDGNDPMFRNKEMTMDELLTWTLDNRPQDTYPGTVQAYSNFGFCVLGVIIGKITGMSYERYVQTRILEPAGITTMQLGGSTLNDRKPNEVKYYAPTSGGAYNFNEERLSACGGWIASAKDLARFIVRVDDFPTVPDILSHNTIMTMITRNGTGSNYACGWTVRNDSSYFHNGGLPGTSTLMVRAANEFNWVLLCNGKNEKEGFSNSLDQLMRNVVANPSTVWSSQDLFK